MVASIDATKLMANFEADAADCIFADGDLENLSHFLQAYYRLPTYLTPFLIGYGSGASLAYATLAQAPADTFAGALTLGFCPALNLRKPLCKGSGIEFTRRARRSRGRVLAGEKALQSVGRPPGRTRPSLRSERGRRLRHRGLHLPHSGRGPRPVAECRT